MIPLKFTLYLLWIAKEIVRSNLVMAKMILSFREIVPTFIVVEHSMKYGFTRFLGAQSITLTPATITVDCDHTQLVVHSIFRENEKDIKNLSVFKYIEKLFTC